MTDQPAKPRRRWKRWTVLALVLFIGCGVWMASGESETVRKGRQLRIGMTAGEVEAVMGKPVRNMVVTRMSAVPLPLRICIYATPSEDRMIQISAWLWVYGLRHLYEQPQWPVEVHIGHTGHVVLIRRADEEDEVEEAEQQ